MEAVGTLVGVALVVLLLRWSSGMGDSRRADPGPVLPGSPAGGWVRTS